VQRLGLVLTGELNSSFPFSQMVERQKMTCHQWLLRNNSISRDNFSTTAVLARYLNDSVKLKKKTGRARASAQVKRRGLEITSTHKKIENIVNVKYRVVTAAYQSVNTSIPSLVMGLNDLRNITAVNASWQTSQTNSATEICCCTPIILIISAISLQRLRYILQVENGSWLPLCKEAAGLHRRSQYHWKSCIQLPNRILP
jgi:hypothetical protein